MGCDDGVGHPLLVNRLDFETHLQQGCRCELLSVELHPYELEVLAGCKVGLLIVDDPAEILDHTDGHLGMQLGLFWSVRMDQPVVQVDMQLDTSLP